jgi:hypothetical protein
VKQTSSTAIPEVIMIGAKEAGDAQLNSGQESIKRSPNQRTEQEAINSHAQHVAATDIPAKEAVGENPAGQPLDHQTEQKVPTDHAQHATATDIPAKEAVGENPAGQPLNHQTEQKVPTDHAQHATATDISEKEAVGENLAMLEVVKLRNDLRDAQGERDSASSYVQQAREDLIREEQKNIDLEKRLKKQLQNVANLSANLEKQRQDNADLRNCFGKAAMAMMWDTEVALTTAECLAHNTTKGERWLSEDGAILLAAPKGTYFAHEVSTQLRAEKLRVRESLVHTTEAALGSTISPYQLTIRDVEKAIDSESITLSLEKKIRKIYTENPISIIMSDGGGISAMRPGRIHSPPRQLPPSTAPPETNSAQVLTPREKTTPVKKEGKGPSATGSTRGRPGKLSENTLIAINKRRNAADTYVVMAATKEDIQRTIVSQTLIDLFLEQNIIMPSTARMISEETVDNAAWVCTTNHPSGFVPMHGYGHKSCQECKKSDKKKMMDFVLSKHDLVLHMKLKVTVQGETGRLSLDGKDLPTELTDFRFQLDGDTSAWKLGKTFTRKWQNIPSELKQAKTSAKISKMPLNLVDSTLRGIRMKPNSSNPIVPLKLILRVHHGSKLAKKYEQLSPRTASERSKEIQRVRKFHAGRLMGVFEIDDMDKEDVEDLIEDMVKHLKDLGVITEEQIPNSISTEDITATTPGRFDITKTWFVKSDLSEFKSKSTLHGLIRDLEIPEHELIRPGRGRKRVRADEKLTTGSGSTQKKNKLNTKKSFAWPRKTSPSPHRMKKEKSDWNFDFGQVMDTSSEEEMERGDEDEESEKMILDDY